MPDIFVETKKSKDILEEPEIDSGQKVNGSEKNYKNAIFDRKVHLFSSFCLNPDDISFEDQDKEEKILLFVRKSKILNLKWIALTAILAFTPFIILPFIDWRNFLNFLPFKYLFYFTALYFSIVVTYAYVNFITWYFNIALITNLRLIDVDFSGLIYKNIAITKLSLVQDVSFTQVGVVRNMFNYGDILVQTAASLDNFIFEAAPNPEKASHTIENLIGKHGTV